MRWMILLIILSVNGAMAQEKGQEKINQTDANGLKQGKWIKYHDNDSLRYIGQFKNDKPYGTFQYFYEKGGLQTVMKFRANDMAASQSYYPDGTVMAEGNYKGKVKDSVWIYYNRMSTVIAEESYVEGKKYGVWKVYYPDGKLAEEKEWQNDLENGHWRTYFDNGLPSRESMMIDGSLEGEATFYHENGEKRFEGSYYRDAKHGIWKTYDEEGQLIDERKFVKGVPEERESDWILEDTTKYIKKDYFDESDVYKEDYLAVPSKEEEKKNKKDKK